MTLEPAPGCTASAGDLCPGLGAWWVSAVCPPSHCGVSHKPRKGREADCCGRRAQGTFSLRNASRPSYLDSKAPCSALHCILIGLQHLSIKPQPGSRCDDPGLALPPSCSAHARLSPTCPGASLTSPLAETQFTLPARSYAPTLLRGSPKRRPLPDSPALGTCLPPSRLDSSPTFPPKHPRTALSLSGRGYSEWTERPLRQPPESWTLSEISKHLGNATAFSKTHLHLSSFKRQFSCSMFCSLTSGVCHCSAKWELSPPALVALSEQTRLDTQVCGAVSPGTLLQGRATFGSQFCPVSLLRRHLPLTQPEPIAWTGPGRQPACPPSLPRAHAASE